MQGIERQCLSPMHRPAGCSCSRHSHFTREVMEITDPKAAVFEAGTHDKLLSRYVPVVSLIWKRVMLMSLFPIHFVFSAPGCSWAQVLIIVKPLLLADVILVKESEHLLGS